MAQKVQVQLIDDLDGSEAIETVNFGFDGTGYEIDLSGNNAHELRASLAEYVEHARRAGSVRAVARRATRSRVDTTVVRQWLLDHGYTIKDRGRIPAELQEAYDTSTPNEGWIPTRDEVSAIGAELQRFQPPQAPLAELSPEAEAAITEVIADAKDEVRRQRLNRTKATSTTKAPASVPAATKATASAPASPTAEAPTKPLKRPTQRAQRKGAAAKDDAKADTPTM